ncbi:MAG TPA: oxygen-independent coproporphyrinogen III oxidase [Paenibacillaceae bacterium]|nr:oxygen-independent coproporphyrinogen III oxidase [Paenibacillaceae bacterium]
MANAVYIHIPFCMNRCFYCDFHTYVTREPQVVWNYLQALEKEIGKHSAGEIHTIYVGGGTPTFLDVKQMDYLLSIIEKAFPKRGKELEFTMEANPGTIDQEKLRLMKQGGVNRLSYGVQSFHDGLLKKIGRNHSRNQSYLAIEEARKAGIENISIDLMFGLPDQTMEMLEESLREAFQLKIPHLSVYSLKVEENTVFSKWERKGTLSLPDEDTEFMMFKQIIARAEEEGFHWYEISNFARNGYESKHNQVYWENREYYGFGAGAHGYLDGVRYANIGSTMKYIKEMKDKNSAIEQSQRVSIMEQMEEFMMLGLRMLRGVSPREFHERYGKELKDTFGSPIDEFVTKGLLEWKDESLRLTRNGVFLGNNVFAGFLSD